MVRIVQQAAAQLPCSFELCCLKVAHVDLGAGTGLGFYFGQKLSRRSFIDVLFTAVVADLRRNLLHDQCEAVTL
jgi:hypothetical protein